jgi:hypothetical protein
MLAQKAIELILRTAVTASQDNMAKRSSAEGFDPKVTIIKKQE